jgi:spore maturation protein CgeB
LTAPFDIVILGLTVTSSWGNGHATTWRGLIRGLAASGERILFLERDAPWYADNRDDAQPKGASTVIYQSVDELTARFEAAVSTAKLVIVGSYVPDGIRIGEWVNAVARGKTAFYDIDTPVTLAQLETGSSEYITPDLIRQYDAYFSFTGGSTLRTLESRYGSPRARVLHCSVDEQNYYPTRVAQRWDLGYLGTYSEDRQPALESLLLMPAQHLEGERFVVVGPQYPETLAWPANVDRILHLAPREHPPFYCAQRYTLNITREVMKRAGYSPSVRLFEAGACGVPVISDWWVGLDSIFTIGREVLVAEGPEDMLRFLRDIPESRRLELGAAARKRVLAEHTPAVRASQIKSYLKEMNDDFSPDAPRRHRPGGTNSYGVDRRLPSEREGKRAVTRSSTLSSGAEGRGDLLESPVAGR